jgi:VWFA-related protein
MLVVLVAASLRAQQTTPPPAQTPVFRATADLVEVHAVVTDRSGAIVRGLAREDFRVAEDGQPQDVVLFSFVDKPLPGPAPADRRQAAPADDVATNAQPADRRLYAIVLDASSVDASRSTVVKRLARQFIEENLGPNDLAAIIQLGRTSVNQQFTSDKTLLVRALDQFIGHKAPAATITIAQDALLRPQTGRQPQDSEAGARSNEARRMLESLKQVCESLGTTRGFRRSLILFSEGVDVDTSDLIGQDTRPAARGGMDPLTHDAAKTAGFVLQAQLDLYAAARRSGVSIYPVDPRGNTMGEDLQMHQVDTSSRPISPVMSVMGEVQRGQGVLRTMADVTGGLAVVGTGAFKAGFGSIVEANSAYYVLGYRPANTARDGAFRRIAVSVSRSDLSVVARKGYVAPVESAAESAPAPAAPNSPSARMRGLLASELPVDGLPVRLSGGIVRPEGDEMLVAFALEIDTTTIAFLDKGGLLVNDIELAYVAINSSGTMVAGHRAVGNLALQPAQRAGLATLRYVAEFAAPAGRYQVRVAAHEGAGDMGGTALLDVDVPDLSRPPLSLGAILLSSTAARSVPTTGKFPRPASLLPAPPTAARQFARSDTLAVFASVFDREARPGDSIEVLAVVRGSDGREVFRNAVTKSGADVVPGRGGYGHTATVALAGLAPGDYELTVGAKSSAGKNASKTVPFSVR